MKAVLKNLYSTSLPGGESELPTDPHDFWEVMKADIGTSDSDAADCFTFYVTSPKFLAHSIVSDGYQLGRGLLVMNEFDWNEISRVVESLCARTHGDDFSQIALKLSRYFQYEFEDEF